MANKKLLTMEQVVESVQSKIDCMTDKEVVAIVENAVQCYVENLARKEMEKSTMHGKGYVVSDTKTGALSDNYKWTKMIEQKNQIMLYISKAWHNVKFEEQIFVDKEK